MLRVLRGSSSRPHTAPRRISSPCVVRLLVHVVSSYFYGSRSTLRAGGPAVTPSCYAYFRVWVTPGTGASLPPLCYADLSATRRVC